MGKFSIARLFRCWKINAEANSTHCEPLSITRCNWMATFLRASVGGVSAFPPCHHWRYPLCTLINRAHFCILCSQAVNWLNRGFSQSQFPVFGMFWKWIYIRVTLISPLHNHKTQLKTAMPHKVPVLWMPALCVPIFCPPSSIVYVSLN